MSVKVVTPGQPETYYFDERFVPDAEPKPAKKAATKKAANKK